MARAAPMGVAERVGRGRNYASRNVLCYSAPSGVAFDCICNSPARRVCGYFRKNRTAADFSGWEEDRFYRL